MNATLTLHLHGAARVVAADGQDMLLERRAAALCALAALDPGLPRERAALWIWPDSPDPRRNLRQQLLRFKRQYGRALLEGEEQLQLATGVRLATGEAQLLQDHAYDDCAEFAAWCETRRKQAQARRRESWRAELAQAEADGDLDAALAAASRHVAAAPESEEAGQQLMRVHFLRGESAAGLAAFEQLRARLAAEGTEPTPATRELAEALRRSGTTGALARTPTASLPVTLKRPPVLAGREAELDAVRQAWREGCAVLIEGEAGLGKSRLIAEVTAGLDALAAAGRPGDAGAPYATLSRWLAPLLARGLAALDQTHAAALAHIAPATQAAGTAPLRPGALQAAVHALLDHHGVHTAVLDDLHFADGASIELAAGLVAMAEPPRRWLFAQRPAEAPAAAQALGDALSELQRLAVVTLSPLSAAAAATLVEALAIRGLDGSALAPALVRHTGGNPLYLLETLKQGLHDGSLARGELPRPANVGALIERRLQRLSSPAMTLARVAAIAGVDFSIELAEAATGQSAVQLAEPWHELQEAQVLRDEAFAHDLVADAARRSVPPVVARRIHAQCAQWLDARGVEPSRVAWHWLHGGEPARAGQAFIAAARRAESAIRLLEEAALCGHAAEAFAAAGQDEERFAARSQRVRALSHADFGDQALQEAREMVETARTDSQRLRAGSELCGLLTERTDSEAAIEAGQAAMVLARQLADHEWAVRTACHLATALCRLGRADEAVAVLLPLRKWVDGQPDEALRMLWHGDWAAALGHQGRLREAVAAYDTALAASRRAQLRDAEGRLLLNCAVTLRQGGQFDRALALSLEGRALSTDPRDAEGGVLIDRLLVARDQAETGHFAMALPVLEAVLPAFEASGADFWAQATRMVLVRLWLDLGQPARAVPLLREEPAAMPPWLRADRLLLQLELARLLQQAAPAGALSTVLELAATDAARGPLLRVRALRHEEPAAVLAAAPALAATLRERERFGGLMGLQVLRAAAALAEGHGVAATEAARAVLALFDEGIAPDSMYRAEASWVAHRALVAAGHAAEAKQALALGTDWLRQKALPHVPAVFIDGFLQRNPVNRALLNAAGG